MTDRQGDKSKKTNSLMEYYNPGASPSNTFAESANGNARKSNQVKPVSPAPPTKKK